MKEKPYAGCGKTDRYIRWFIFVCLQAHAGAVRCTETVNPYSHMLCSQPMAIFCSSTGFEISGIEIQGFRKSTHESDS
jgi:hypothetical protein